MANYETEAVVIGSKNVGDADKMVTLFTLGRGKVKAMAYGARRVKNPLAAPLQVFHQIDAELSEGKNIDVVRNASLKERFPKIGEDLSRMAYGMFFLEILAEIFPENTQEVEVYEFAGDVLRVFEERNPRVTANLAVWKILNKAGFNISLDICPLCGKDSKKGLFVSLNEGGFLSEDCHTRDEINISEEAKELLSNIIKFEWKNIDKGLDFKIQGYKLAEVEILLIKYLSHILGFKPKSLKFIQGIQ